MPIIRDQRKVWEEHGIRINGKWIAKRSHRRYTVPGVRELCLRYRPKIVLEVGFGCGSTADAFQEFPLDAHHIVEIDPDVAEIARSWAVGKKSATIHEGDIRKIASLGPVSLIYADISELPGRGAWSRHRPMRVATTAFWIGRPPDPLPRGFEFAGPDGLRYYQPVEDFIG